MRGPGVPRAGATARSLAALLVMLAAGAARAVPTEGWPLTPEESSRIDQEHAAACGRLTAILDRAEALRSAYASAGDRDEALRAWGGELDAAEPLVRQAEGLSAEHRRRLGETDLKLVLLAVAASKTADPTYSRVSPEYQGISARGNAIDVRTKKGETRYWSESERRAEALAERRREREYEDQKRTLIGAGVFVAALLLSLAVWVTRRPAKDPKRSLR